MIEKEGRHCGNMRVKDERNGVLSVVPNQPIQSSALRLPSRWGHLYPLGLTGTSARTRATTERPSSHSQETRAWPWMPSKILFNQRETF